ncbi:MAG: hypothetical protein HYY47_00955 [Deltaproteobacteria bacterium]|nr:hypothetical protein [Deltaproteobacteria bacterium]MBI2538230.1 hypothetical protein [Deltaproteobacteria bacterium]MBI2990699.1 hypothetical protein [Deltaproteobacteria bacterium]MBI3060952.1 hypothetical protein [Deltaproteobacteria bacterium]
MPRKFYLLLAALSFMVLAGGCEKSEPEGPAEKMGKEIDKAAKEAGQQFGEALEKTGQALEEAGKKLQKKEKK